MKRLESTKKKIDEKIKDLKSKVNVAQAKVNNFDMTRFDGTITGQERVKIQKDLNDVKLELGIIETQAKALKTQMQTQQSAYDARVGTDMTFAQYASENYERPYAQMGGRYDAGGPAEKAWKQYTDKLGTYKQDGGSWSAEGTKAMTWHDLEDSELSAKMKNYEEKGSSWSASDSSDPWSDAGSFSDKRPDMPKFK